MKQHERQRKRLLQFRNHSLFQSVKQELTTFGKNVSVFQANLFRCRLFGYKRPDVLTGVQHSKRVKTSLIKGDVARKRSLFRVRIVQNECFGILSLTNKTFLCGFIGKFVLMRFNVFESSTPKNFQIGKNCFFHQKTFRRAFYFLVN